MTTTNPFVGVVLITRCGCKRYMNWPSINLRSDIIIPLTPSNKTKTRWYVEKIEDIDIASTCETRQFEETGQIEYSTDNNQSYKIYQEI